MAMERINGHLLTAFVDLDSTASACLQLALPAASTPLAFQESTAFLMQDDTVREQVRQVLCACPPPGDLLDRLGTLLHNAPSFAQGALVECARLLSFLIRASSLGLIITVQCRRFGERRFVDFA